MKNSVSKSNPEKSPQFRELCRQAGRAVGRYRMIRGGERILVGVSGGKDSLILTHILYFMQRRSPVKFELLPAVFDPGFPDFNLAALRQYCRSQGWPLRVVSAPMTEILREKGEETPCLLCSRLRRGKLYGLAQECGCTHLALGQHFDDAAASFLISLFRGQGLTSMGPNVGAKKENIRIIRPLILSSENLIAEAAALFDFPQSGRCLYKDRLEAEGDRAYFKRLLGRLEERIPHWRSQMLRSLGKIETDYLFDERFLFPD